MKLDIPKSTDAAVTPTCTLCATAQDGEEGAAAPPPPPPTRRNKRGVSFSEDTKETDGSSRPQRSPRNRRPRDVGDRLVRSLRLSGPATWGPFTYRPENGKKVGHWVEYINPGRDS